MSLAAPSRIYLSHKIWSRTYRRRGYHLSGLLFARAAGQARITSTTTINASDLDRVAFVPASGFNGVAYVDFTATAASGGGTFTGTVEIVVGRDYSSGSRYFSDMAGYSALQQAAVDFLYDRGVTRGLSVGQYEIGRAHV